MGNKKIRIFQILMIIAALFHFGCIYNFPLVEEHNIAVDSEVIGLWGLLPLEREKSERIKVLKFSDTEYLIHYMGKDAEVYFRGYPIEVGGVKCVQLELLGSVSGLVDGSAVKSFYIATYVIQGKMVEVKTINLELLGTDFKTKEDLTNAFLQHKDDPNLFTDARKYRKIGKSREIGGVNIYGDQL